MNICQKCGLLWLAPLEKPPSGMAIGLAAGENALDF